MDGTSEDPKLEKYRAAQEPLPAGHPLNDIQSGVGFVHNSLMLAEADIEKTVVRGPFRMPVKPTWWGTNKTAHKSGELFAKLMAKPSWGKLPGLVTTAMRG